MIRRSGLLCACRRGWCRGGAVGHRYGWCGVLWGWLGFDVGPDAGWGVSVVPRVARWLKRGVGVFESADVFLLIGELALAVVVLGGGLAAPGGGGWLGGYAGMVSLCRLRSISVAGCLAWSP